MWLLHGSLLVSRICSAVTMCHREWPQGRLFAVALCNRGVHKAMAAAYLMI